MQPGSLLPQRSQLREHCWFLDACDASAVRDRTRGLRLQPSSLLPQRSQLREHRWFSGARDAVAVGDRAGGLRLQPGPLLSGQCYRDGLSPRSDLLTLFAERRLLCQHCWFPDAGHPCGLSPADFRLQPSSLVPCKFCARLRKKSKMSYLQLTNPRTERRFLHQHRWLPDAGHPGSFRVNGKRFPFSLTANHWCQCILHGGGRPFHDRRGCNIFQRTI